MTVETDKNRVVHNGDGASTLFAIDFPFLETDHLAVFLRTAAGSQVDWVENTQYTVAIDADGKGGALTVQTAPTDYTPAAGEKLFIVRRVPATQTTDYKENDDFPSEAHERALNKLTMLVQQLLEALDRTITIPETDTAAGSFELPGDTVRANKFLGFDFLGNITVLVGTDGNISASAFVANTLLNSADAAAFMTGLGFSTFFRTLVDDPDAPTARATLGVPDEEQAWLIGQTFGG